MWKNGFKKIKHFLLDILFPKTCLGCKREGSWLCEDCVATLDIQNWSLCPICQKRVLDFKTCEYCRPKTKLTGLFVPLSYENPLIKRAIQQFKYKPFVKELSQSLSFIIISHLKLIEFPGFDEKFILVPIPLYKSRLRWRGYNQAEEIAKELSLILKIPHEKKVLIKTKNTLLQAELKEGERWNNVIKAFLCQNQDKIKNKKILLVDDVYTTGATMEECAKILKESGAKEVWGIVVARG